VLLKLAMSIVLEEQAELPVATSAGHSIWVRLLLQQVVMSLSDDPLQLTTTLHALFRWHGLPLYTVSNCDKLMEPPTLSVINDGVPNWKSTDSALVKYVF